MTIVRVGSTRRFSEGWDKAFRSRKKTTKTKAAATRPAKRSAKARNRTMRTKSAVRAARG